MKDFKKYYIIPAQSEDIYLALTNPATIQLWTGEFEPNKKIQQEWYFGEQENASIVTIKLHQHKQGCSVELVHTNIPNEAYDDIVSGWNENYFGALEEFYS